MKKWHKASLVIFGATLFSTIAIQAGDILRTTDGNLLGMAIESSTPCDAGAVLVNIGLGSLCVDQYEASAGDSCPVSSPETQLQTQENLNNYECASVSKQSVLPWRYVSLAQAQQICARSGKRLPSNDEWHALANSIGDDTECIVDASAPSTTGDSQCVTYAGIYDMVGNVWEWVDEDIVEGQYNGRMLPESGFVQSVDSDGIVVETASVGNSDYGNDYAITNLTGVRGILRGGFYGSGPDAGQYAQNLSVPLNSKTPGVGFRCVKNL